MSRMIAFLPHAAWHGLKVGAMSAVILMPVLFLLWSTGLSLRDPLVFIPVVVMLFAIILPLSIFEAERTGLAEKF